MTATHTPGPWVGRSPAEKLARERDPDLWAQHDHAAAGSLDFARAGFEAEALACAGRASEYVCLSLMRARAAIAKAERQ